jgi:hypothetical protein
MRLLLPTRRPVAGPVRADNSLADLVGIACHDLRGSLAAVYGLARTLSLHPDIAQRGELVRLMGASAQQFGELLDDLELVARIEADWFEPSMAEADSIGLAQTAAVEPSDVRVAVSGEGASILVPQHAPRLLARVAEYAALRGGREDIKLVVHGSLLELSPISRATGRALIENENLPIAVAATVALIEATGGSLRVDDQRLRIDLPTPSVGG